MTVAEVLFEDADLTVSRLVVDPLENNVFFLRCLHTGKGLMVDAPSTGAALVAEASAQGVGPVVITHSHHDHVGAIDDVRAAGYKVGVTAADQHGVTASDFEIVDGAVMDIGKLRVEAIATPGHTAGSVCFKVQNKPVLFTGDTLFPGGPGATRSPDSSFPQIMASLRERLFVFDDDTIVFPGHGTTTTLEDERPSLDEWEQRGW